MNKPILLDTNVLLWSLLQPDELPESIIQIIATAQDKGLLLICSISLWEIAMLQFKKRINIYEPVKDFLDSIVDINGLNIRDISSEIAAESVMLIDDFHGDPADRIIVATTKCYNATLFTRDHKILTWSKLGHIRALQA